MAHEIMIRPFEPREQILVQSLILEGLTEHFDSADRTLNPDLHDIEANYLQRGSLFLVAEIDNELVGTGALVAESENVGRIVRLSVSKSHRRLGIGRLITERLIEAAGQYRFHKIVVETNDDWYGAIYLYQSCGFTEFDRYDGEIHMSRML